MTKESLAAAIQRTVSEELRHLQKHGAADAVRKAAELAARSVEDQQAILAAYCEELATDLVCNVSPEINPKSGRLHLRLYWGEIEGRDENADYYIDIAPLFADMAEVCDPDLPAIDAAISQLQQIRERWAARLAKPA